MPLRPVQDLPTQMAGSSSHGGEQAAPRPHQAWVGVDSPSVFASILDRDAGGFRLGPADIMVPAARRYLPGTLVLETSWATPTGWIIVRDLLLMGSWHHDTELSRTHRRAP